MLVKLVLIRKLSSGKFFREKMDFIHRSVFQFRKARFNSPRLV